MAVKTSGGSDIHRWFEEKLGRAISVDVPAYFHLPEITPKVCTSFSVEGGYTGVTEDEFRKYWMRYKALEHETGQKETEGKLHVEYDFNFLRAQLERMGMNKAKYEEGNWKKPINVEELKKSMFRHVLNVMEGEYEDDGREFGHLEAIALNAMFIYYQLKNHGNI